MGVYSTIAAEQFKENQMIENFHFTDLLEFAVNTEVANQRMFNAMIELDFHEAVEKMNGSYLTEAETETADAKKDNIIKKLADKIFAALRRFGELLSAFIGRVSKALKDFLDGNKMLASKFGSLTADRVSLIDVSKYTDVKFEKYIGDEDYKFFGSVKDLKKIVSDFQTVIYGTKTDEVAAKKDEILEQLKSISEKSNEEEISKMFKKEVSFADMVKDTDYLKKISDNMTSGYKGILKVYSNEIEDAKKDNNSKMKEVQKDLKEAKSAEEKARKIAILEARYQVYNTANAIYAKFLRAAIVMAKRVISDDRRTYCTIGAAVLAAEKAANKKTKDNANVEVQHNNALIESYQIAIANEEFMNSIFE